MYMSTSSGRACGVVVGTSSNPRFVQDDHDPIPNSAADFKSNTPIEESESESSMNSVADDEDELLVLDINQHLQEDELLALESIYGDNINILLDNHNAAGLKCFQVHIHVQVPKGFLVTTTDHLNSFQVEHLPPIVCTFLLPKSYPSTCPPHFTISVQWLGPTKISDLCRKLDLIWLEEAAGHEVIYEWVEWLHASTLSFLGFHTELLLNGPYDDDDDDDDDKDIRAISGTVSPDTHFLYWMKSYDDEKRNDNFCQNIQECSICLTEFAGSKFTRLPCEHFFCEECLKTFVGIHVTDGTVLKLKCPEPKCDGVIPPGLLKRLLGEDEVKRWESLLLEKTLESMVDVVYCPRCETPCLQDEDDKSSQCAKCFYSFCTLCRDRRHVGVECMTPEMKLNILQERQHSSSLKSDQRQREHDMINEILSLREVLRSTKQCPRCNIAIVRSQGCNHMVCRNCNERFCYGCSKPLSSGYAHNRCDQEENADTGGRGDEKIVQVAAHIAKMFPKHVRPCPNCAQQNLKVGNNNHILCWACQNHYCCLCRKMVRRSSEHYGPKGCKQHTAE